MSFAESFIDYGDQGGESGQDEPYFTHNDPFQGGSSHYGPTDSQQGGDIEQGFSSAASRTGSQVSDHRDSQTSFTHIHKANNSGHIGMRNNNNASTFAGNMVQGAARVAPENDIMPWGPFTTSHVSLPVGASSAMPSANPYAVQSSSSAWSRLPQYHTLAQSMLGGTEAGRGLATGSETRPPDWSSHEGVIGATRTQRRAG